MTIQDLQLSPYNWRLTVFYNIQPDDIHEVILTLWESGCPNKDLKNVALTLQSPDTGFTFTNRFRQSVMGICRTTSKEEFINTIVHEIKHLQSDICHYYNIEQDGEQAALMAGEIAMSMYKDFKRYII